MKKVQVIASKTIDVINNMKFVEISMRGVAWRACSIRICRHFRSIVEASPTTRR